MILSMAAKATLLPSSTMSNRYKYQPYQSEHCPHTTLCVLRHQPACPGKSISRNYLQMKIEQFLKDRYFFGMRPVIIRISMGKEFV